MRRKAISLTALWLAVSLVFLSACESSGPKRDPDYYNETYRNQFHFSPEANWMNDPNGMVYYKGEYHLFYQYHPHGTQWGPMHWGHAVSKDLVHWEHLPIALFPDKNGYIFSGSAVIDWNNTAGFGKEAMVAIFTHAGDLGQVQSLAYSLDRGRTWEKYEGNPVMPNPPIPDWRDPKVYWHEESQQWVMVLAAKDRVMFYTSPNLKEWTFASEFGPDGGIQANSLDRTSYAMSSQTGGGSFVYEGDITLYHKNGREGLGGLVFRADRMMDNGYVVSLDAQNDVVTLSKNVNGTLEELARESYRLDTTSTYHLKVDVNGSLIQVYVDGDSVLSAEDDSYQYGYYGLTAWNSTVAFRNVQFHNTSNFISNIFSWQVLSGSWSDTMDGKNGTSADGHDAIIMSEQTGDHFFYESDIRFTGTTGENGTASLIFRSDAKAENGYYASLDAANGKVSLARVIDGVQDIMAETRMTLDMDRTYHLEVHTYEHNISVYLDGELVQDVVDATFASGQFGLKVSQSSALFQNVTLRKNIKTDAYEIENPDFETGDLTGWNVIRGHAFTYDHVTDEESYWGGTFDHQGKYHYWGFSNLHMGDGATGEMHSSYFKLGGSGEINFLMGGGNDKDNLYVALVRASDDQELIRQANTKFTEEKYNRYVWDASKYLGEVLYIKVVDQAIGGWGHINLDDIHVYNEGLMPEEVDQVADEPDVREVRLSGLLTDWVAVSGEWIPSTHGSNGGTWECPALVELPIDGDPAKTKWVLLVSISDGAPAGGSGMQYFIGDFDGTTFKNENPSDRVLWVDYGADFYAAVDWNGIEGKNGEKYWLGWMSNWQYANHTPTITWRGSMTLPRTMELTETEHGLRLKQTPISLKSIRDKKNKTLIENEVITGRSNLLSKLSSDSYEMIAEFDISDTEATEFGFEVRKGDSEVTTVGYDIANRKLFVDRRNSGFFDYGMNVKGKHEGPLHAMKGIVKMHIFVDRSAIEVFGNDGETVITDQIFPDPNSNGFMLYSKGGEVILKSLEIYPLKSIWR